MKHSRRFFLALRKIFFRPQTKKLFENVAVKPGCILHCDLGVLLEHTGVYIGNGKIVSLNRHGHIKTETAESFFPPGTNPKSSHIYVACYGKTKEVLSSKKLIKNARKKINEKTEYNVVFNNCHRFTAGCISGDFESDVISFSQLEEVILTHIEQLREKPPLFKRILYFFKFKKNQDTVQPATLNWRIAEIPIKNL